MYALKKVKMNKLGVKERENALNEVRILASLSCPFIIAYKQAFYDDSTSCLCIIMQFAQNGDLSGRLEEMKKKRQTISEDTIWKWTTQILFALNSLHRSNIMHRDLKCANVFLSKDYQEIKIGDLNVSKVAKTDFVHTQTGTPYYASPQIWKGDPYDYKCDIWSVGCVIYELAVQHPPFLGNSMQDLFKKITKGQYD